MISVCGLFFRSCVRVHVAGLVCVTTIGRNGSWNEIALQSMWMENNGANTELLGSVEWPAWSR